MAGVKNRDKILNELSRRLLEVNEFEDKPLNSQKLAQNYFSRIADYMNYVQVDSLLKSFCENLKQEGEKLINDKQFVKESFQTLNKVSDDLDNINKVLKKKKFEIIPIEKIVTPGVPVAISTKSSISLTYQDLKGVINRYNKSNKEEKTQYIFEVAKCIRSLWMLLGSMDSEGFKDKKLTEISDSYQPLLENYEKKRSRQDQEMSYLRITDYERLSEVWRLFYDGANLKNAPYLRLLTGDILASKTTYPHLYEREAKKLNELKEEYSGHLHRFNNYLTDRLEEKVWYVETAKWLLDSFGKTFAGLALVVGLWYLLNWFGVKISLEFIKNFIH